MKKYYYNGTILPALPETVYQYAAICKTTTGYMLGVCDSAPIRDGLNLRFSGTGIKYKETDGAWVQSAEYSEAWSIPWMTTAGATWANVDIYNTDGTLHLAASEPVPVLEIQIPKGVDRYSYVVGFNLALAGMAYPYSAPTPVAYLYNGIRLPALPEWDRGVYPYAFIREGHGGYKTILIVSSEPVYIKSNTYGSNNEITSHYSYFTNPHIYFAINNSGKWTDGALRSYQTSETWYTEGWSFIPALWANSDIVWEGKDGFAVIASDPVPVYE